MIDYEAEYNNRARVPECLEIMGGWARDAAAYRAENPPLMLRYGPGERQRIDLFEAGEGRAQAPVVMFIHGGYWQALDGSSSSHLARGLNAQGVSVAVPTYDLCPEVSVAEILEQMRAAARLLHERGGQALVVAGHSAGGHLAACLLAQENFIPAAWTISGLFDLPPLVGTSVNAKLGLDEAQARRLSPIGWPPPAGKTLRAVVGGDESAEYHRQSRDLVERWRAGGVAADFQIDAGRNHFTVIAPLAEAGSTQVRDLAAMTKAVAAAR